MRRIGSVPIVHDGASPPEIPAKLTCYLGEPLVEGSAVSLLSRDAARAHESETTQTPATCSRFYADRDADRRRDSRSAHGCGAPALSRSHIQLRDRHLPVEHAKYRRRRIRISHAKSDAYVYDRHDGSERRSAEYTGLPDKRNL